MSFLAPFMLLGLLGISVPIAIHLIGRSRAKVVRFAALDFLMASKRRTARRLQLRERLLLLVRALACLAVPLALAKPFTSCHRQGPTIARGPQAAVIVVDDSFATAYKIDGAPVIDRIKVQAQRILAQLGPEAEIAVIHASEGSDQPVELSRDHIRLRDQLTALVPSNRPADTTRALSRAGQLLAGSNHKLRTVYLVSLMAKNGFRPDEPPWGSNGPTLVAIDPLGETTPRPNLAVTHVGVTAEPSSGARGIAVTAELANFGPAAVTGVEVSLRIGDDVVARGLIDIPAGAKRTKRFVAALAPGARIADASVELPPDALNIDNRAWVRTKLREQVRVLLVDGDPRTTRHDDEVFYLAAALRPGDRDDSGTSVTTITTADLATADLPDFDVIVLANVSALPAERVTPLTAWVHAGGGLLVAAGDHVDAAAYSRTMQPLLPQAVRDPIDTGWGASDAEQASRALRLTKWESDHPIFAPFSSEAPGLTDAKFGKIMLLGPTTATSDRKVLARFTNGAAALVEATTGQGRLMLFTSTLDRDWNDLPIHPGYLPLMQGIIRHLARTNDSAGSELSNDTSTHLVGRSVELDPGDLTRLEVRGPGNVGAVFDHDRLAGRHIVRFTETTVPGIYHVLSKEPTGAMRPLDEQTFAVNLDARGSDLTPIAKAELPPSGTGGGDPAKEQPVRVELWHAVAAALLLLLLIESILAQR